MAEADFSVSHCFCHLVTVTTWSVKIQTDLAVYVYSNSVTNGFKLR